MPDWDGKTEVGSHHRRHREHHHVRREMAYCPGSLAHHLHGPERHAPARRNVVDARHLPRGTVTGTTFTGKRDSFPGDRVSPVFAGGRGEGDGTRWYVGNDSKPQTFGIPSPNTTAGTCDRGLASSSTQCHEREPLSTAASAASIAAIDANTWWAACTRSKVDLLGSSW